MHWWCLVYLCFCVCKIINNSTGSGSFSLKPFSPLNAVNVIPGTYASFYMFGNVILLFSWICSPLIAFFPFLKSHDCLKSINPTRENYKKRVSCGCRKIIAAAMELEDFSDVHVKMKFKNLSSSYSQGLKRNLRAWIQGVLLIYIPKVTSMNLLIDDLGF